jgi:cytochrome c oxidase cbb3-type subunit IV
MDMVTFRSVSLVLIFAAFTGIVIWAYSKRPKKDFEEASRLALDEDDEQAADEARKRERERARDERAGHGQENR